MFLVDEVFFYNRMLRKASGDTHTHTRTHAHAEAHDVDVVVVVVDDVFKTCVVVVVFIGSTQLVPNFIPVPT